MVFGSVLRKIDELGFIKIRGKVYVFVWIVDGLSIELTMKAMESDWESKESYWLGI